MAEKGKINVSEPEREIQKYLSDYSVFRRIWEGKIIEKDRFGNRRKDSLRKDTEADENDISTEARVKMFESRRLVTSLPSGDEKLFLFLRYIHGESMESCAERIGISPRHIFRLRKSAHLMAYRQWKRDQSEEKKNCME